MACLQNEYAFCKERCQVPESWVSLQNEFERWYVPIFMKKKLLIVGAGSVGKFVAYNIDNFTQEFEIIGFLDDDIS